VEIVDLLKIVVLAGHPEARYHRYPQPGGGPAGQDDGGNGLVYGIKGPRAQAGLLSPHHHQRIRPPEQSDIIKDGRPRPQGRVIRGQSPGQPLPVLTVVSCQKTGAGMQRNGIIPGIAEKPVYPFLSREVVVVQVGSRGRWQVDR